VAKLTRAELLERVHDQLEFLDASCRDFDAGRENEAVRLATQVRIICHHTKRSPSVFHQLGVEETIMMRDSVPIIYYQAEPPDAYIFGSGLSTVRLSAAGVRHVPRVHAERLEKASVNIELELWWNLPVIFPRFGERPSRKTIVLWLAHKLGGAHVSEVPAALAHLRDGRAMGIGYFQVGHGPPVVPSPLPAGMRQIAEEMRVTLRETFADELPAV